MIRIYFFQLVSKLKIMSIDKNSDMVYQRIQNQDSESRKHGILDMGMGLRLL